MATLPPPPLLEPFYNIETPAPTLDHGPLLFDNDTFDNDAFDGILAEFKTSAEDHESDENNMNQSHDNDALPPPIDIDTTPSTDNHIGYHKTTNINTNWSPGLQAMHKANNKKATATNNRKKAQHKRHSAPIKPVPKCPYKLLDVREKIESSVMLKQYMCNS